MKNELSQDLHEIALYRMGIKMKRSNLKRINKEDFSSFFELMEKSFPSTERRSCEDQRNLFKENSYKVFGHKDSNGKVVAFIATWEFEDFIFIEHFAVHSKMRCNGIGSVMLKELLNEYKKPIFLEVEEPETDIAERRIRFYKRLGFNLNSFDYLQPPLQKHHEFLPLKVMSYPSKVNVEKFKNFKNQVYEKVYKVKY